MSVPDQKFPLAAGDTDLVDVVVAGLPVIEADDDGVRGLLRHGIDQRPHFLQVGEVAGRGHTGVGFHLSRRIDGVDVEILVAVLVLHIKDVAAVLAPEVPGHRPLVCRHRAGLVERFLPLLHPDIAHLVVLTDKRDVFAVRRNLGTGDFRVAEEELPVDDGRARRQGRPGHRQAKEEKG